MKVTIELEIADFEVPDFVQVVRPPGKREDGLRFAATSGPKLSDLSAYTLDALCDNFREAVFKKAGKEPPPTAA